MSAELQFNGVTVKTPKEFSVSISTIDADSSGRNANGEMVRDVIAQKTKRSLASSVVLFSFLSGSHLVT